MAVCMEEMPQAVSPQSPGPPVIPQQRAIVSEAAGSPFRIAAPQGFLNSRPFTHRSWQPDVARHSCADADFSLYAKTHIMEWLTN